MIQQDMKSLRLKKEHTGDRKKWRSRLRVADPSSEREVFKQKGVIFFRSDSLLRILKEFIVQSDCYEH